eukprot:714550-Pleurochrysis_carterae.AAC.4
MKQKRGFSGEDTEGECVSAERGASPSGCCLGLGSAFSQVGRSPRRCLSRVARSCLRTRRCRSPASPASRCAPRAKAAAKRREFSPTPAPRTLSHSRAATHCDVLCRVYTFALSPVDAHA